MPTHCWHFTTENGHLLRGNLINGAILRHHICVVTSPQTKNFHTHGGSAVKNPPAMQELKETQVQYLVWEDPLEEEMVTHSSILACRIPWTEEPSRLQSQGVGHDWSNLASPHLLYTEILWGLAHFIDEVRGFVHELQAKLLFLLRQSPPLCPAKPSSSLHLLAFFPETESFAAFNSPPGSHGPCSNSSYMPHS